MPLCTGRLCQMKIDLHTHTRVYSGCSLMSPVELVRAAAFRGLDGVVLTEHDAAWPPADLEPLRELVPELVILRGMERSCAEGHVLLYGELDYDALEDVFDAADVIRIVHDQGGVAVMAHPYRTDPEAHRTLAGLPLDAIEVASTNTTAENGRLAMRLARELGVPMLAMSDAHRAEHVGLYYTEFDRRIRSEAELAEALRAGHESVRALTSPDGPARVPREFTF